MLSPPVVIVTIAHQKDAGIEGNIFGLSATSQKYTNVAKSTIETIKKSIRNESSRREVFMVFMSVDKLRE